MTTILDKLLEYKRNWIQHVNRMPRNRLPRVMKHYSPTGRRNHGRPLKRLLDMWEPKQVNKWPKSMTDIWWWWWWTLNMCWVTVTLQWTWVCSFKCLVFCISDIHEILDVSCPWTSLHMVL
jgi:hypothetical protein